MLPFNPYAKKYYSRAADETRTHDLFLTKEVLYQLSYSSKVESGASGVESLWVSSYLLFLNLFWLLALCS